MSSSVSRAAEMREQSVLSTVNELENTIVRGYGDSLDGKSSSSVRVDYQQLMEDHTQRTSVLERYRLMVERRRGLCQQKQQQQQQQQQQPQEEDRDRSRHCSASTRVCGSGVLSERRSVNETMLLSSKASERGASMTASSVVSFVPSTTTTTTTNNNNNNNSTTNTAAVSVPCRLNSSCKWMRPRNALVGNTASFSAKQRKKVKSAPITPRQQTEQHVHPRRRSGCEFTEKKGALSVASRLSSQGSLHSSQQRQRLQCHKSMEVSLSVSSSSLVQQSRSDSCGFPEITPKHSTIKRAESGQQEVCHVYKEGEEEGKTVTSELNAPARSCVKENKLCDVKSLPPSPPQDHDISTLEIETEEDKQLLEHQMLKAVYPSASERIPGSVSAGITRENSLSLEKHKEEKEHPQSKILADRLATDKCEEPSFMTSVTAHTIDMMSPILERFGRRADEATSKSGRDTKPLGVSLVRHEPAVVDKCLPEVKNNVCAVEEIEHVRSTAPQRASRSIIKSTLTNVKDPARAKSNVSPGRLSNVAGDDKTVCIATVTALLQGIIVQTRRVLPCYYCGEPQHFSAYRLHLGPCQARTEALYTRYGLNPLRLVMSVPKQSIPGFTVLEAEMDAFVHACYQSVKESIMSCPGCGVSIRIHDFPEHEDICKNNKNTPHVLSNLKETRSSRKR